MLLDRLTERAALGQLLEAARGGRSGALVVHGEAGVGKTALLEDAIASAAGMRIARVAGIESEMELAYAALQQLCAPMLDDLDRLPDPQREALGVVFGLRAGEAPDRFLVGLALEERVRERFVAEAGGNPLALLELPQGLTPAELAGASGVTAAPGLLRRLEDSFGQRLGGLPETTQRLLLVAAAEPTGDPVLGWRAAGRLRTGAGAGAPAGAAGVVTDGPRA